MLHNGHVNMDGIEKTILLDEINLTQNAVAKNLWAFVMATFSHCCGDTAIPAVVEQLCLLKFRSQKIKSWSFFSLG